MNRRFLTLVLVAVSFVAALRAMSAAETSLSAPPNFVIILADDLGYSDLSCYGSKTIRTPHLDRMAQEGLRFTEFHSTASICSPSRASILTGRYPARAGMPFVLFPTEKKGLPPEEVTLPEALKTRGYTTACIGKWHLGTEPQFHPLRQGFDYFFGLPYSNDSFKQPANEPFHPVRAPVELPLIRGEKVIEAPVSQETLTERYTEEAIAFIRKNKKNPFFLYLAHTFPHKPLYASKRFQGKSQGGLYGDTVECIDWSTGEILRALKKMHLDEKTLVVFVSDNGPAPSGREFENRGGGGSAFPLRAGKFTSFEGGFRVPAIVRWPGKIPAGTCSELASTLDFFPTFTRLAGVTLAQKRVIDGKDIWPLLSGQPNARSPYDHFYYYLDTQLQAVRQGPWKLFLVQTNQHHPETIFYATNNRALTNHFAIRPKPLLFNLENDLSEQKNVAVQHPEIVARLTQLATEFDRKLKRTK